MHRVLLVSHDADHSGAPRSLRILARHFAAHTDWELRVLLRKDGPVRGAFEAIAPTRVFGPDAAGRAAARGWVAGFAPSLVYANTAMNGDVLADLERSAGLDAPVLVHVRDRLGLRLLRGVSRDHFLYRSDRLLCVSEAVRRELEVAMGFDPGRVGRGPVCLDVKKTRAAAQERRREAVRAALGVPAGGLLVGNAGLLIERKGPDLFVAAAAALRERLGGSDRLRFVWVGEGPERRAAEAAARAAGLAGVLRFVGLEENPQPTLAALDLLLMTSRDDPFPRVVLEAGLHAVPSVAFADAGGAVEFLLPPGGAPAGAAAPPDGDAFDPAALAAAARPLLEDADRRAAAGVAAAERAEGFDAAAVTPGIIEEVDALLAAGKAGTPVAAERVPPGPPGAEPGVAVVFRVSGDAAADARSLASVAAQSVPPAGRFWLGGGGAAPEGWEPAGSFAAAVEAAGEAGLIAPLAGGCVWDADRVARMLAFVAATPGSAVWRHPLRTPGGAAAPPLGWGGAFGTAWEAAGRVNLARRPESAALLGPVSGVLLRRETLLGEAVDAAWGLGVAVAVAARLALLRGPLASHPDALGAAPDREAEPDPGAWIPPLNAALARVGEPLCFLLDPSAPRIPGETPAPDARGVRTRPDPGSAAAAPTAVRGGFGRPRLDKHGLVTALARLGLENLARRALGRPGAGTVGPGR